MPASVYCELCGVCWGWAAAAKQEPAARAGRKPLVGRLIPSFEALA